MDRRRALTRGGSLAALALLALFVLLGGDLSFPGTDGETTTSTTSPTVAAPAPGPEAPAEAQVDTESSQGDQTTAAPDDGAVPAQEATAIVAVLAKIESAEPLPYDQDGTTFSNREGRLPQQPEGYYKEYTVETPGSDDRGARRLVIGAGEETYYTRDHYDSFTRIDPEDYR